MWWVYYILPSAPVLEVHRDRSFVWGYSQMVSSPPSSPPALAFTWPRLSSHKAHISPLATVLTVAVPVSASRGLIYALYYYLVRRFDPFHVMLLGATAGVVAVAIAAATSGVGMAACLVILMFVPAVTVAGYETRGYRHQAESLVN